jgi:hypothetical protein
VFFPFYNPAFAIGIGIIYWLITWEFQSLVTKEQISLGKIDELGLSTTVSEVLPLMPLYLVQAMVASVSLTILVAGLYAVLVWYVDAIDRPGVRRYAVKFLVGTAHFLAHMTAMFTLSLLIVSWNNQTSPLLEREFDSLYQARERQPQIVKEQLETIKRKEEAQRAQPGAKVPTAVRQLVGFTMYPALMIGLGALVGGSLWGLYWVVTGVIARMHSGEAFAALRIQNYKNFLRLKFEPDKVTIYPLGIDRVPGPDHWLNAPRGRDNPMPHNPKLIAAKPIDVRLIENPIVIMRQDATAE